MMQGMSLSRILLLFIIPFILYQGCAINYLQETTADGPPIRNLVKITHEPEQGQINLRGAVSINSTHTHQEKLDGHTLVDENGVYRIEPVSGKNYYYEYEGINTLSFTGDNFTWKIPDWQAKAEVDFSIFDHVSFLAGASVSSLGDETYLGTLMGMAFKTKTRDWGLRIDFGVNFQQMHYTAQYMNTTSTFSAGRRKVYITSVDETEWQRDLTFGLTANTFAKRAFVNYFFNYSFGLQTFFDFTSEFDNHYELTQFYHSLALGVYKDISDKFRIMLGIRGTQYSDDDLQLLIPDVFLQYDLRL